VRRLRVLQQRGGLRSARRDRPSDSTRPAPLEHVATAGDDERCSRSARQHRLEPSQDAIGAPVLASSTRAHEIAWCFSSFASKALEEREGIGCAAGEAGEDAVLVMRRTFFAPPFDDDLAERDLARRASARLRRGAR